MFSRDSSSVLSQQTLSGEYARIWKYNLIADVHDRGRIVLDDRTWIENRRQSCWFWYASGLAINKIAGPKSVGSTKCWILNPNQEFNKLSSFDPGTWTALFLWRFYTENLVKDHNILQRSTQCLKMSHNVHFVRQPIWKSSRSLSLLNFGSANRTVKLFP